MPSGIIRLDTTSPDPTSLAPNVELILCSFT